MSLAKHENGGCFKITRENKNDFLRDITRTNICSFEMYFENKYINEIRDKLCDDSYVKITHENKKIYIKYSNACGNGCYMLKIHQITNQSMFLKFNGIFHCFDLSTFLFDSYYRLVIFCSVIMDEKIFNLIYYENTDSDLVCVTSNPESATEYYYNMKWTLLVFMYEQHYDCLCYCLFERILADEYLVKMILKY